MTRIRVRKARRNSVCPLCRAPILTGQQISDGSSRGWVHIQCLITEQKNHRIAQRDLDEPGERQ